MKVAIILLALFMTTLHISAAPKKPKKKELVKVIEYINQESYGEASDEISNLLIKYPNDPYLQLQQGICYLNMDYKADDAIPFLTSASTAFLLTDRRNDNAIEARFYLAQAYHLNHRFEEALKILLELKDKISAKQKEILTKVNQEINYSQNAIQLKAHPVQFRISNLGQAINSEFDEHSPVLSADESLIVFTSNRQGTGSYTTPDGLFYEDIHQSTWREGRWLPALNIGSGINTDDNDATSSLSADGQTLIIYRNNGISGNLFMADYTNNGWSEPKKLPRPINSTYNETHGSLADNGQTLYFSSDRPGGFGGSDIYRVSRLPDGSWGKVVNLGPTINTPEEEESPFLHPDGHTLYFASTAHSSMGGYDIFKSTMTADNQWTKPENIGYPINTPADDIFYIPTSDGQRVYFASERPGGFGRSDIYVIEFPETDHRAMAVVAGFLFKEDGNPSIHSQIKVEKKESGESMGIYKPHPDNGKYILILPTGNHYTMTITTDGLQTITKTFEVPSRADYPTKGSAIYLDPQIIPNE